MLFLLFVLFNSPCYAGNYGMYPVTSITDWKSSNCQEPSAPSFYVTDTQSYNNAVDKYNDYVTQVDDFLMCMEREANQDISTLTSNVRNSVYSKKSEMKNEAQRTKYSLDLYDRYRQ